MRRLVYALVSVLFAALYTADAQAQAPLQKIRVTIPVPVLTFYPLYVARDHGDFAVGLRGGDLSMASLRILHGRCLRCFRLSIVGWPSLAACGRDQAGQPPRRPQQPK